MAPLSATCHTLISSSVQVKRQSRHLHSKHIIRSSLVSTSSRGTAVTASVHRKQQLIGINSGSRKSDRMHCKVVQEQQGAAFTATTMPVRGVLFDMDGVLCDSEERSRDAAVEYFSELGVSVKPEDFIPFMGTGEANFLGGVAHTYGIKSFDPIAAKNRFFEIYIEKYAKPNSGLGFPGALELVMECKKAGLKLAVASSADRIKVNANLSAAGLPLENFDAIVSADVFERLKPAPDIFLAAAKALNLPPAECVVIEDALAGIQAAQAAGMRCIAVSTTLSEERLTQANPTLIKKNIGDINLSDVLSLQGTDSSTRESVGAVDWIQSMLDAEVALPVGLKMTRRDAIRFASLSVGTSCLAFVATHWKAMSYISPMAIVNDLLGVALPVANGSEIGSGNRLEMFKRYISDFEAKGGGPNVPEFPPGLKWLNTAAPLRFKGVLRGKLVILDFWTYCCINCMHILPDLSYLEDRYRDQPFTVVGVHSAKFDNEKDIDAIRNAVLRYNVSHPVVNDGDMNLWRQLGISSWPTLVVVSPKGKVLARLAGEGHREELKDLIDAAIQYYGEKKLLNIQPNIPQLLEKDKDTRLVTAPLSFPGKITTDLANGRLFISDSNHHRIVVTDLNGNFILQVGNGDEGLNDGSFELASFNRPQGVAYNARKNVLYVADTENHALREVNFVKETVKTLAGTGEKGHDYKGGKTGQAQPLNSPWDLCLHPDGKLYIAMAGQHQIWEFDTINNIAQVFSGDGYERNLNGSRGSNSSYAQPSGVALAPDMDHIYIADSESSSVRSVDLRTAGSRWLSGGDPSFPENLFQFGDKDGTASQALFQHPLGVAVDTNALIYIADSYNHKIKVMNVSNQTVKTIAGTGVAGYQDGNGLKAQFSEPAGLAIGPNGSLFVSDTNNNLIRVIDFKGDTVDVSTLQLKGIVPPEKMQRKAPRRLRKRSSADMEVVRLQPVSALKGDLNVDITLPPGFHFSKEATSKFDVDIEPDGSATVNPMNGILEEGKATLRFNRTSSTNSMLRVISKVYYCEEEVVCLYKGVVFEVPLEEGSGEEELALKYSVAPQKISNSILAS